MWRVCALCALILFVVDVYVCLFCVLSTVKEDCLHPKFNFSAERTSKS